VVKVLASPPYPHPVSLDVNPAKIMAAAAVVALFEVLLNNAETMWRFWAIRIVIKV